MFSNKFFHNYRWLREFIDDPYRGHIALIEFLQYLHLNPPPKDTPIPQELQSDMERTKSRSHGSTRSMKPEVFARSFVSYITLIKLCDI